MRVKLRVLVGKSVGKEIEIPISKFLIGRSDECHLRPKSESISRNHCAILTREDKVVIRDLNSRNGTFINSERISGEAEVKSGDKIQVGKLDFEIVLEADVDNSSAELTVDEGGNKTQIAEDKTVALAAPASITDDTGTDESRTENVPIGEAGAVAARPDAGSDARTDDSSQEFDVSTWLEEADKVEHARRRTDPDTRQFKLDDVDREKLAQAAAPEDSDSDKTNKSKGPPDKKQPPGKLPQRSNASASSREAAAEMLKKYFRR